MANYVVINDNTLRQRLRQFGFRPDGPITDTTRDVYVRKLQQLERNARGVLTAPAQTSVQPSMLSFQSEQFASRTLTVHQPLNIFTSATPHPDTSFTLSTHGSPRSPALQVNHRQDVLVARSAPSEDANRSSTIVHGKYCSRENYFSQCLKRDMFR